MRNNIHRFLRLIAAILASLSVLPVSAAGSSKTAYSVYIVVDDNQREKFIDVRKGFCDTLDAQLALVGAKAAYTVLETKSDKNLAPSIVKAIQDAKPDLIAVINSSAVFADMNITAKLTDPAYRFVSENCIPVQSGIAKTWEKPGGNVTGVGVFTQFTSIIKLAQMINPGYKKLIFWSWDAVKPLNEFLEQEIRASAKATGIEVAESKRLASAEDQFEYMELMDKKGPEYFAIEGVSAWVHRDGSYANMNVEFREVFMTRIKRLAMFTYDEAGVKSGNVAGACVVWYDLGAQMAEKGVKVLGGANPGDIPWSYPRKYNIMLNLAAAKLIKLTIPERVIGGAYRVYTDFDGNFVGQKN